MIPMHKTTPENYKCCILRMTDPRSEIFVFNDVIKCFFMVADARLVTGDPILDLADGEVPIFDMKGVSMWHLFKISLSTLRLYFKYVQEAHPGENVCRNNFRKILKSNSSQGSADSRLQLHTAHQPHHVHDQAVLET